MDERSASASARHHTHRAYAFAPQKFLEVVEAAGNPAATRLLLLAGTGLRVAEACALTLDQLPPADVKKPKIALRSKAAARASPLAMITSTRMGSTALMWQR